MSDFEIIPEQSANEAVLTTGITVEQSSFLTKSLHATKRSIEGAVLFAEVTPINEAMRVAAGGVAIAAGLDPISVAAVYGGATMAIESAAALAAASWLDTTASQKRINWLNEKLQKRGISPEAKFSPITKAGIAFLGGSAIVQVVKHREEPERSKEQNRKYGLKTAAGLAGACAVQGYFVANGIEAPNMLTLGGAAIAVGSIFGAVKWGRRRVNKEEAEQGISI